MQSSSPSRHTRRRRALSGAPRLDGTQLTQAQFDLLLSKIEEDPTTGCWTWTATRNAAGYGIVVWATKCYRVHRLLYEYRAGAPVADGLDVDHVCNRRDCVNPSHLEAVSHAENLRRIRARDARPLFDWRSHRDYSLALSHLVSIEAEG